MNDEAARWHATEAIFHEALQAPEPDRSAILIARCGGDTALMDELRALLAACEAEEIHRLSVNPESVRAGASVGPYVIEELVGRGGMGAVYRAHRSDGQYEQLVAIKIIDIPLASDFFRERFRAERQMLAGLSHPYIARLLDGGVTEDGELYLVMEFIDGITISDFCQRGNLSVEGRLRLFLKVCEAVQYAHRNLIVHRDLKPENVLVTEDSTPRLLDFGTAKMIQPQPAKGGDNATRPGMHAFTPRYASPEQVLGQPISIASDIYSLGVLLYVLLTSEPPYQLTNFSTEELVRVICTEQPSRPSSTASPSGKIDADLDSIVLKALRKDPKDRYATVEHLAKDIEAYLDRRPVEARRGNFRYVAGKFIRRNKVALAGASLLLLSLLAGAVGIFWQSHLANLQRVKADTRSTELRELSTSLLTEIDSSVKDMPGSTPVQRQLVGRVLEHLDRLAKETGDDPVLALDMLNAYTRLGNLEGNPYGQNLGDPKAALATLDRALSFAPALHIATTADPAALRAFGFAEQSRSEVLYALGRDGESAAALQSGLHALDTLAARPDATADEIAATGAAYNALGDQRNRAGNDDPNDPQSSIAAYRHDLWLIERVLKLNPNHPRARRGVALITGKIGGCIISVDPVHAAAEVRRSVAAWKDLPPEVQSLAPNRQGAANSYQTLGFALGELGDYSGALAAYDEALNRHEQIAESDPKDTSGTYWVASDLLNKGRIYLLMLNPVINPTTLDDTAHRKIGMELLRHSVSLFDQLYAVDPGNPTWIAERSQARIELGTLEYGTAHEGEGADMARAALETLRVESDKPNAPLLLLAPAVIDSLLAMPLSLRSSAWTLQAAQRLNDRTHHKMPEYLLALAQAYRANGDRLHAVQAAQEGLTLLAPTPPGTNKPRVQRLLEIEVADRGSPLERAR